MSLDLRNIWDFCCKSAEGPDKMAGFALWTESEKGGPLSGVWMTMCHCRRKTVIKGDTIKNQTNKNQTILFRYGDSIKMLSFLLQNTTNVFHKGVGNKWRWVDLRS